MNVGQILRVRDASKRYRLYRVTGIYLGGKMSNGNEVEDLIGIEVLDKHHGSDGPEVVRECFVPEPILRSAAAEVHESNEKGGTE